VSVGCLPRPDHSSHGEQQEQMGSVASLVTHELVKRSMAGASRKMMVLMANA
jgi:hypothetical protein